MGGVMGGVMGGMPFTAVFYAAHDESNRISMSAGRAVCLGVGQEMLGI